MNYSFSICDASLINGIYSSKCQDSYKMLDVMLTNSARCGVRRAARGGRDGVTHINCPNANNITIKRTADSTHAKTPALPVVVLVKHSKILIVFTKLRTNVYVLCSNYRFKQKMFDFYSDKIQIRYFVVLKVVRTQIFNVNHFISLALIRR